MEFFCNDNQLVNLVGGPKEVGEDFWCFDNQLANLDGSPEEVGGSFDCCGNNLVDFVGLEDTEVDGTILAVAASKSSGIKTNNNIVSLRGLREEYYDKVKGLNVAAIKAREQDISLDVMV